MNKPNFSPYDLAGNLLNLTFSAQNLRKLTEQELFYRIKSVLSLAEGNTDRVFAGIDDYEDGKPYVYPCVIYDFFQKYLFWLRDKNDGYGERKIFRVGYTVLLQEPNFFMYDNAINNMRTLFLQNLHSQSIRWDDAIVLIGHCKQADDILLDIIRDRLQKDLDFANDPDSDKQISNLAKWMPNINTSSNKTREKAEYIARNLSMSSAEYRKTLSKLRKLLDVPERKMSENKWDEIKSVPSGCMYKNVHALEMHNVHLTIGYLPEYEEYRLRIPNIKKPYQMLAHTRQALGCIYSDRKEEHYNDFIKQWETLIDRYDTPLRKDREWTTAIAIMCDHDLSSLSYYDNISSSPLHPADIIYVIAAFHHEMNLRRNCNYPIFLIKGNAFYPLDLQTLIPCLDASSWDSPLERIRKTLFEGDSDMFVHNISMNGSTRIDIKKLYDAIADSCKKRFDELPKNVLVVSSEDIETAAGKNNWVTYKTKVPETDQHLPNLIWWNANMHALSSEYAPKWKYNGLKEYTGSSDSYVTVNGTSNMVLDYLLSEYFDPREWLISVANNYGALAGIPEKFKFQKVVQVDNKKCYASIEAPNGKIEDTTN